MKNEQAAGSLQGLHLVVRDIDEARRQLGAGGVAASDVFHFEEGVQVDGPDPGRADYGSFLSFSDPDGNGWLVQEVPSRDRVTPTTRLDRVAEPARYDAVEILDRRPPRRVGCGGPSASTQRTSM